MLQVTEVHACFGGYSDRIENSRCLPNPPQNPCDHAPLLLSAEHNGTVLAVLGSQHFGPLDKFEPAEGEPSFFVPGDHQLSDELPMVGVRSVDGNDVSLIDQRLHRCSPYPQASCIR